MTETILPKCTPARADQNQRAQRPGPAPANGILDADSLSALHEGTVVSDSTGELWVRWDDEWGHIDWGGHAQCHNLMAAGEPHIIGRIDLSEVDI